MLYKESIIFKCATFCTALRNFAIVKEYFVSRTDTFKDVTNYPQHIKNRRVNVL